MTNATWKQSDPQLYVHLASCSIYGSPSFENSLHMETNLVRPASLESHRRVQRGRVEENIVRSVTYDTIFFRTPD